LQKLSGFISARKNQLECNFLDDNIIMHRMNQYEQELFHFLTVTIHGSTDISANSDSSDIFGFARDHICKPTMFNCNSILIYKYVDIVVHIK